MLSAIFSFLGGSAFRMIWGEVSSWINKKLEHEQEMERLAQQEQFAAAQHARNLEAVRVQADLQVKVIEVQAQGALDQLDAHSRAARVCLASGEAEQAAEHVRRALDLAAGARPAEPAARKAPRRRRQPSNSPS